MTIDEAPSNGVSPPDFSTDWSAAMLAAEEFGLFGDGSHNLRVLHKTFDGWAIRSMPFLECPGEGFEAGLVASAERGPLAICRTIILLAAEAKK